MNDELGNVRVKVEDI